MINWKFIKPNDDYTLDEKIAYTEGAFNMLSQLHANLSVGSDDIEWNKLNVEIREYMGMLKQQLNQRYEIKGK